MQEGYFYRDRRPQERVVITQKTYRLSISIGYFLYAAILVGLVLIVDIKTVLVRDDFIGISQLTSSIAAICLAIFPLIQVATPKSYYLKLAIASLSMNFVLATLLSFLALATTDINNAQPFHQTIRLWILTGILLTFSITGISQFALFTNRIAIAIGRLRLIDKLRPYFPHFKFSGKVTDYSSLVFPFIVILVWSNPLNLVSATIVLTIGGLVYLVVLSATFALQSLHPPVSEDDKMKFLILEILKDFHIKRFEEANSDNTYDLISIEEIRNSLVKRQIFKNERYLQQLVEEMAEENLMYVRYNKCYIFPTSNSFEKIAGILDTTSMLITGSVDERYNHFTYDGIESTFLVGFLSSKTKFPPEIISNFFLPTAYKELNASFDFLLSSNEVDNSEQDSQFIMYAKSKNIKNLWMDLESQQELNKQALIVRSFNEEADYSFYSWFQNNIEVVPKGILDSNKHVLCKKVFIIGIAQILGIDVQFEEEPTS